MKHSRFSSRRFGLALVVHLAANVCRRVQILFLEGSLSMSFCRQVLVVFIEFWWRSYQSYPVITIKSALCMHQTSSTCRKHRPNHHAAPGLPTAPCHWALLWQCPHSLSKKGRVQDLREITKIIPYMIPRYVHTVYILYILYIDYTCICALCAYNYEGSKSMQSPSLHLPNICDKIPGPSMASPETTTIVLCCALQAMHICLTERWGIEIRSSVPWRILKGHSPWTPWTFSHQKKGLHFVSCALQCLRCHLKHTFTEEHRKLVWIFQNPQALDSLVGSANCFSRTFRPGATFRPRCGSASTGTCPREDLAENVRTTKENPFKGIPGRWTPQALGMLEMTA